MAEAETNNPYAYDLPQELIGTKPAEPRDSARLFVFDTRTGAITFDRFSNIGQHLPENSMLVLNDTRVVPARLMLYKANGAKVEALLLLNEWHGGAVPIKAMVDRRVDVGEKLHVEIGSTDFFEVSDQVDRFFLLRPNFDGDLLGKILEERGKTPRSQIYQRYRSLRSRAS